MTTPPTRDFIDQMAAHWLAEEQKTNPAFVDPAVPFVGMLEIARDRVLKVYEGEVRWSEASPGDRAVWIGRPRNREVYERYGERAKQYEQTRVARANRDLWRGQATPCLVQPGMASPAPAGARYWHNLVQPGMASPAPAGARYWHNFTPNVIAGAQRSIDPKAPDPCSRCRLTREQAAAIEVQDLPARDVDFHGFPVRQPRPAGHVGPVLHGYRERFWWNFYDTVTLGAKKQVKAFSNASVGDYSRTNMPVGNQLGDDFSFVAMDFYVVPCLPAHEVPWNRVFGHLVVGNRHATPRLPLAELFMGTGDGWEQRPYLIPVRQHFEAVLEIDETMEPFDLVVHLEGLLTREVL